ncbi:hypothetical protein P3G55_17440 [Leptospira sp. 96542]|nr:hypothetical protein [Leptospira sp. 96542]
MEKAAKRRSPIGVVSEKPIGLRLMQEEKARVVALAEAEVRSVASMSRLLVLKGLEAVSPPAQTGKARPRARRT